MIGVAGHASICPCCFCQLMVKKVAKVNHPAPDHMERAETAADKHARSSLFWDSAEPQVIMRDGHKMKEWHDRYLQANSGMQTAMREAGHASAGGLVSVFGPAYVGIIHVEYGHAMGTLPPPAFFSLTHAISPLSFFSLLFKVWAKSPRLSACRRTLPARLRRHAAPSLLAHMRLPQHCAHRASSLTWSEVTI